jgi:hypothetical protein
MQFGVMYSTYMYTNTYRTCLSLVSVSCTEFLLEITTCWHIVFRITVTILEGRTVRHARALGTMLRVREVVLSVLVHSGGFLWLYVGDSISKLQI